MSWNHADHVGPSPMSVTAAADVVARPATSTSVIFPAVRHRRDWVGSPSALNGAGPEWRAHDLRIAAHHQLDVRPSTALPGDEGRVAPRHQHLGSPETARPPSQEYSATITARRAGGGRMGRQQRRRTAAPAVHQANPVATRPMTAPTHSDSAAGTSLRSTGGAASSSCHRRRDPEPLTP